MKDGKEKDNGKMDEDAEKKAKPQSLKDHLAKLAKGGKDKGGKDKGDKGDKGGKGGGKGRSLIERNNLFKHACRQLLVMEYRGLCIVKP